ncbi:ABC transporter permease [Carboxylicivirga sediminis]|uniref:ABC transporter permease n=1 Tax=Carboxylicivirga sediminis TaxID=2006564 RepID=A0A941F352_9BACT|nr:ABC transporter permease [Carboxylicivirga sediminis]MBR8535926.1 ABC transporter permease [Carboxylicivirga sediminis]
MNIELFIARKIASGGLVGKKLAGPVIKVAMLGIILGMVVMIVSLAVGFGFKGEIREKISGFASHIQIMSYDYNYSPETNPISIDSSLEQEVGQIEGVKYIQRFATKPGIVKANELIQGIVLKGVDQTYNWEFIQSIMVEGRLPVFTDSVRSDEVLISEDIASMLKLKVGDKIRMYFIQDKPLQRRLTITGIYNSHFPEYDKMFAFVDLRHIQKLNGWENHQISGYEVGVSDFRLMHAVNDEIYYLTSAKIEADGTMLRNRTIEQLQPQIFGWLDLLDTNVYVILILIILVASFNMISGLLILILERTNMIGILKALGSEDWSLRKVFVYLSGFIIGRGLLWGNIIGILVCIIQKYTRLIKLDPANYYLSTVPIYITPIDLLLLNIGVLAVTISMMLGPSYLVARILPVKAIRFN